MLVRFYAFGAPSWWPFQLVSLTGQRLPPQQRPNFYYILVDNGMFKFYRDGERPSLDRWLHRLLVFVKDVERLRKPNEIWVVLPDWLGDFDFTLSAAMHPLAKRICKDYCCLVVAHAEHRFFSAEEGAYAYVAGIMASLDHIYGIAAPLKLSCLRYDPRGRRHVVDSRGLACQVEILRQVCKVARKHGLVCHGLGIVLKLDHVRRCIGLGPNSFDSTGWTRASKRFLDEARARMGRVSATSTSERELFFKYILNRLRGLIDEVQVDIQKLS